MAAKAAPSHQPARHARCLWYRVTLIAFLSLRGTWLPNALQKTCTPKAAIRRPIDERNTHLPPVGHVAELRLQQERFIALAATAQPM
jgi:hypothetical protein